MQNHIKKFSAPVRERDVFWDGLIRQGTLQEDSAYFFGDFYLRLAGCFGHILLCLLPLLLLMLYGLIPQLNQPVFQSFKI